MAELILKYSLPTEYQQGLIAVNSDKLHTAFVDLLDDLKQMRIHVEDAVLLEKVSWMEEIVKSKIADMEIKDLFPMIEFA